MKKYILHQKGSILFVILGGFFVTNALVAEFLGSKLFSLERSFGLEPVNVTLFGVEGLSFEMTTGVLLWPVVFVMTDVINEYFGKKGVRYLSILTAVLIGYSFLMILWGMQLPPSESWHFRETARGKLNMDLAFNEVFGQSLWIIVGSLTAFLIGQMVDALTFQHIKEYTGQKMVWLRATGSTFVSQFIDSYVVLFIGFYIGADLSFVKILAIGTLQYSYKFVMAIILTPVIYFFHYVIDIYLGESLSKDMKQAALEASGETTF